MDKAFTPYLEKIEKSLMENLPSKTNPSWQKETFGILSDCVNDAHIQNLILPCRSLVNLGGKRWRPLLMVLCYRLALESGRNPLITEDETYSLTSLVEFVHTASLIHDDIEDGADTRRGEKAAHIKFGLDTALNAGSWLYFQAAACIQKLNASDPFKTGIHTLYTTLLRRLHLGQAMDIYWHRNPDVFPSPDEYTQMVRCKTGTLSSLAVSAGLLAGGFSNTEIASAMGTAEALGEGFQILDDVQNLTTGNPGKKRGDDIVEGKKSLPVLLHIQDRPEDAEKIVEFFKKASAEGPESDAVEGCIKLLEAAGSITRAKEKGTAMIEENAKILSRFGGVAESAESSVLISRLFSDMMDSGAKK